MTGISLNQEGAIHTNSWGDGFVTVFNSAQQAVIFALEVRDTLHYFDWRAIGITRPLLLRTAVATGSVDWPFDPFQERVVGIGNVFAEAARIEPISRPGAVFVTDTVSNICRERPELFFHPLGVHDLPKGFRRRQLFSAHWATEQEAVEGGRLGPLLDDQYYRREEAL